MDTIDCLGTLELPKTRRATRPSWLSFLYDNESVVALRFLTDTPLTRSETTALE